MAIFWSVIAGILLVGGFIALGYWIAWEPDDNEEVR